MFVYFVTINNKTKVTTVTPCSMCTGWYIVSKYLLFGLLDLCYKNIAIFIFTFIYNSIDHTYDIFDPESSNPGSFILSFSIIQLPLQFLNRSNKDNISQSILVKRKKLWSKIDLMRRNTINTLQTLFWMHGQLTWR